MTIRGAFLACLMGFWSGQVQADITEIQVTGDTVTVSDLSGLSPLPGGAAQHIDALPVYVFRDGVSHVTFARDDLNTLVRRRVPELRRFWASDPGSSVTFHRALQVPGKEPARYHCSELLIERQRGDLIAAEHVQPVMCDGRIRAQLTFDRENGVVRAADTLEVGAFLGRVHFGAGPMADRGDPVRLSITVGAVEIRRDMSAAHAIFDSERAHIISQSGAILTVPRRALSSGSGDGE